jgi:hypothetical protein
MSNFDWEKSFPKQLWLLKADGRENYNALPMPVGFMLPWSVEQLAEGTNLILGVGIYSVCYHHSSLFSSLPLEHPHQWCSQYVTPCKNIFLTSKFSYLLLFQPSL